jgi:hypothetical protein
MTATSGTATARGAEAPVDEPVGELELVHAFTGPMPTGVTVSHTGRIFVNFPKWGDEVTATVVELRDGQEAAYPDQARNDPASDADPEAFVSVQSVSSIRPTGSGCSTPAARCSPRPGPADRSSCASTSGPTRSLR